MLQCLFYTFVGCDYCTESGDPNLEKIFSLDVVKNGIYLGVAHKQDALLFKKYDPKNAPMPQCLELVLLNVVSCTEKFLLICSITCKF